MDVKQAMKEFPRTRTIYSSAGRVEKVIGAIDGVVRNVDVERSEHCTEDTIGDDVVEIVGVAVRNVAGDVVMDFVAEDITTEDVYKGVVEDITENVAKTAVEN